MLIDEFRKISPDILENEPMSKHTTFKIGGAADMLVSVKGEAELTALIKLAKATDTPYVVIGNGSNLLVGDRGIRGLVIEIGKNFSQCRAEGERIYVEAGALLKKAAVVARDNSLTGLEEVSGIPGTVGGGIYMNAGAYGGELKTAVESVTYIDSDGDTKTVSGDECEFGYRTSIFTKGDKVILSAVLKLKKGDKDEIEAKMAEYTRRRKEKQPLSYPSAGSTFKRPEGHFAGGLIQEAGLKGYAVGGAMVSELHAGFVINSGNATAEDVLTLIEHIQKTVYEKFSVKLETEVKIIGER